MYSSRIEISHPCPCCIPISSRKKIDTIRQKAYLILRPPEHAMEASWTCTNIEMSYRDSKGGRLTLLTEERGFGKADFLYTMSGLCVLECASSRMPPCRQIHRGIVLCSMVTYSCEVSIYFKSCFNIYLDCLELKRSCCRTSCSTK